MFSDESSIPFYSTSNGYNFLDESSIPFYSTSNGYNKEELYIVEYLDYQIPVTQLNGDKQSAKRD